MLKNSKPSLERLNLLGPLILLGALGISLLVVEGLAQLYYRGVIRKNFQQPGMYRYDPRKGWVLNDGVFRQKHYDFEALYTISDGRRRTVSSAGVEHETLNIYGDSFAFGIGVPDEETIASHLSQLGLSSVQNLGVSGYGPDQYFLAYQDAVSRQAAAWHLFLIYTGNDYKDLIAATDEGKQRYKPVLQPKGPGYVWLYPPGYEVHSSSRAFAFYSFQFLKYLAKSSALLIRLYNSLASPDRDLVHEALQRFDYLYSSLPRDKCFFAIVPSLSLVRGISLKASEGFWEQSLHDYLTAEGFVFVNIYRRHILGAGDFWPHEGHPTAEGNRKIAQALLEGIEPLRRKVL